MSSNRAIIRTVSLYQQDWDIIEHESQRMFGEGAPVPCRSAALRRIIRDWHRRQTQISLIPEPSIPQETLCSPTS
jgi:hypothetical protein